MSEIVVDSTNPQVEAERTSLRWRLIPAAFLIFFGIIELIMIAVIFSALIVGKYIDIKLFEGPGSPELTSQSMSGMGLLYGLGVAWIVAGKLIWRRRYLLGVGLAALAYPLGAFGTFWMFSSPPATIDPAPSPTQPPPPPRFDDPRRRVMPKLAVLPFDAKGAAFNRLKAVES